MFDKIFSFNQKTLDLYAKRQEILASNIANVDTPGYKAVDIDFKNEFNKILQKNKMYNKQILLVKTSPNHLSEKYHNSSSLNIVSVTNNHQNTDGNTVNMDRERIEFLDNSLKYQSNLVFMKNEIKNIVQVLKG